MNFYVTGGTLHQNARSYVERKADRDLYDTLLRGDFCYVLTSRQMGKSSLMVRSAARMREAGGRVVALDLTAVGGSELSSEQWYYGILDMLGEQLRLESELEACWRANGQLGPLQRLMKCIRHVVLPQLDGGPDHPAPPDHPPADRPAAGRLFVFVDEIDVVRSLPFSTDDFFAAIRECYNRRTQDPIYGRLTFCLLGVASPSDLIRDPQTTPFNIGHRIELDDFTLAEAAPLAGGLEEAGMDPALAETCLNRVLYWSGGHPYLTQRLCRECERALCRSGTDPVPAGRRGLRQVTRIVDHLCGDLFFDHRARERDDNLVFVRERLLRGGTDVASLLDLYLQVRRGRRVPDDELDPLVTQLRLAGIVRGQSGRLRERNRIYGRVFDPEWIRAHLPQAELRRQREAWLRGVVWASSLCAVVLTGIGGLGLIVREKSLEARVASVEAQLFTARLHRNSGAVGHRAASFEAIGNAAGLHRDRTMLVNEAIATLALPDLEVEGGKLEFSPKDDASRIILPPTFEYEAVADAAGTISLRQIESGQETGRLPGIGWPVVRMEFDADHRYAVVEYAGEHGPFLGLWHCGSERLLARLPQGILHRAIDFSPDGRWLALGRSDGIIGIYELGEDVVREGEQWQLSPATDLLNIRIPQVIRFHPRFGQDQEGEILAVSSAGSSVILTKDLRTAHEYTLRFPAAVRDFAWHPTGRLLAAACDHHLIELLIFQHRGLVNPERTAFVGHEAEVRAVAFNHRGDLLASCGADNTVRVWALASERVLSLDIPSGDLDRIWFSLDDRKLVAAGPDARAWASWRVLAQEYRVLSRHFLMRRGLLNPVWNIDMLDFSPDSRFLAAGSSSSLTLWSVDTGRRMLDMELRAGRGTAFDAESHSLWVSTDSGLVRYPLGVNSGPEFRLDQPTPLTLRRVPDELGSLALTGDRRRAAVAHRNQILLIDLAAASYESIPTGFHCQQIAISPNGTWIAGRSRLHDYEPLRLWHADSATPVSTPEPLWASDHFAFSPDNRWLVVFSDRDRAWQFHRVETWKVDLDWRIEAGNTVALHPGPFALSPDGGLLALVYARSSIRLYDLNARPLSKSSAIATLESPDQVRLLRLRFSPDGRHLAAVTQDQTVQLWDLELLRTGLRPLGFNMVFPSAARN
jgi:WD40 repeat protein